MHHDEAEQDRSVEPPSRMSSDSGSPLELENFTWSDLCKWRRGEYVHTYYVSG